MFRATLTVTDQGGRSVARLRDDHVGQPPVVEFVTVQTDANGFQFGDTVPYSVSG